MQYVFILGHNPKLSVAEIMAVLPQAKIVAETGSFFIVENEELDCQKLLNQLGGTIKIGTIIGNQISKKITVEKLKQIRTESKLNFGVSYYETKPNNFGMEIKKDLKDAGISCRLVTSRDKALSSVVVTKNKCHEFLVLGNKWLGETCVVQEFEEYGFRDFGRPARDMVSGSMPPKLAKIMINLAQLPAGEIILDPFCGSGTVLQEGLLLGYQVIGADISDKAIKDTKKNLEWLQSQDYKRLPAGMAKSYQLFKTDVREISKFVNGTDAVVTEPYLGPPLKGRESRGEIEKTIEQISELYETAFREFKKILNLGGRVVIVFPVYKLAHETLELPILDKIKKLGFTQVNSDKLVYNRPEQKVWRQIFVFKRQSWNRLCRLSTTLEMTLPKS